MKDKILSLCPDCRKLMEGPYRVKGIVRATTEKKARCENCGKRVDKTVMQQVMVSPK